MLTPTTPQLLRLSSALSFSKIHHQRPLTPRESKQLLDLITTSFRRNLDQAHGHRSHLPSKDAKPSPRPSRDLQPVDGHITSILAHPLFTTSLKDFDVHKGSANPIDAFARAVVSGSATLELATVCLKEERRHGKKLDSRSGKEAGAGRQVVDWLRSSGTMSTGDFLDHPAFVSALTESLVAEDLEEHALQWTAVALEQCAQTKSDGRLKARAGRSLRALVQAQAAISSTLDLAYTTFIRAIDYYKTLIHDQPTKSNTIPAIFKDATAMLCRLSTEATGQHQAPIPELFDAFIERLNLVSVKRRLGHVAHLRLHHPTNPSADMAVSFLTQLQRDEASNSAYYINDRKDRVPVPTKIAVTVGEEAYRLLRKQNRLQEAAQVVEIVRKTFARAQGSPRDVVDQRGSEMISIELLDRLGVA